MRGWRRGRDTPRAVDRSRGLLSSVVQAVVLSHSFFLSYQTILRNTQAYTTPLTDVRGLTVSPPVSRIYNARPMSSSQATRKRAATGAAEPEDKAVKVLKKDLRHESREPSSSQPAATRTRQRTQPGAKGKGIAAMVKDDDTDAMIA